MSLKAAPALYFTDLWTNKQQNKTTTTKTSSVCSSSPSPCCSAGASFSVLILLAPHLACFPRTRCIFRFVKSVEMPVMNISTALSVFNVLYDRPSRTCSQIWHQDQITIGHKRPQWVKETTERGDFFFIFIFFNLNTNFYQPVIYQKNQKWNKHL